MWGRAEAAQFDQARTGNCEALGPELKKRGLVFAGIDVIGGYLTEANVTSPTASRKCNASAVPTSRVSIGTQSRAAFPRSKSCAVAPVAHSAYTLLYHAQTRIPLTGGRNIKGRTMRINRIFAASVSVLCDTATMASVASVAFRVLDLPALSLGHDGPEATINPHRLSHEAPFLARRRRMRRAHGRM